MLYIITLEWKPSILLFRKKKKTFLNTIKHCFVKVDIVVYIWPGFGLLNLKEGLCTHNTLPNYTTLTRNQPHVGKSFHFAMKCKNNRSMFSFGSGK